MDSLGRRKDQISQSTRQLSDDSTLSSDSWYRITGLAGNQIATECANKSEYSCYAEFQGWINGSMPTVTQGRVSRTMCFREKENCCFETMTIIVRNCGGYFVYRFQRFKILSRMGIFGHPMRAGKVCTEYSKYPVLISILVS